MQQDAFEATFEVDGLFGDVRFRRELTEFSVESETTSSVRFRIGDVVEHKRFDYRGVVIGVDPQFAGTDEWYEAVARSRPPKDRPWYHVLPNGGAHQTYVADRNLQPDHSGGPVEHPLVQTYFTHFVDGRYVNGLMN